jgi:tetratricopeptide (TPR) repeat protein
MDEQTLRTRTRSKRLAVALLCGAAGLAGGCSSTRSARPASPLAQQVGAEEHGSMVSRFFNQSPPPQGVQPLSNAPGPDVIVKDPSKRGQGLSADTEVAYADAYNDSAYLKQTAVERDAALDTARQKYLSALKHDPKHRGALLGLARVYTASGDKAHAVASLNTALQHYPDDHAIYHRLAAVHFQFEEPAEAAAAAQKALQLDPSNRAYLKTLAVSQAHLNQYEQAFGTLVGGHVMTESEARNFLGRVLYDLGRPAEGRAQLAAAIALDPNNQQARQFLAALDQGVPPPAGEPIRQAGYER